MILSTLDNSSSIEQLHPLFKVAFDYIKATDFSEMPCGKIVLQGDDLFINVAQVNGKAAPDAAIETHSNYIDIQLPLNTTETMGWADAATLQEVTRPYNSEKDIVFYADKATTYIDVQPRQFVVFYPEDGHAPGIASGVIRKLIVKVKVG